MKASMTPTGGRLYLAVKREVLEGVFRPGERIEAAQLAKRHFASITPVRAALQRLVGECLVDGRPREGFHAPAVTEQGLRDLYAWNDYIVLLAWQLGAEGDGSLPASDVSIANMDGLVAATEACFRELGVRSGNERCLSTIAGLNDQLHLARRCESQIFTDIADELLALMSVLGLGPAAAVRRALTAYHRRRDRACAEIVRRLHRSAGAVS